MWNYDQHFFICSKNLKIKQNKFNEGNIKGGFSKPVKNINKA